MGGTSKTIIFNSTEGIRMDRIKEPDWLSGLRTSASLKFKSLPPISHNQESFKYTYMGDTDLSIAPHNSFSSSFPHHLKQKAPNELLLCLYGPRREELFSDNTKQLIFSDLLSALEKNPALVEKHMSTPSSFQEDKLAQLAIASWGNGAFIHIPDETKISPTLKVRHYFTAEQKCLQNRSIIILGKNSECTIVEEMHGDDSKETLLSNGLLDVFLGENAKLKYIYLQFFGENTQGFSRQQFSLSKDASMEAVHIQIGGKKIQQRVDVNLKENGSTANMWAMAQGNKTQHLDSITNVYHRGKNTTSKLEHFSILSEKSNSVFNALANVKESALNSNVSQKSRCLLLSDKARAHGMPKLIVKTNELVCYHGFSTSRIDKEQMYYLESRGIDPQQSLKMSLQSFATPVISKLPTQELQDQVFSTLEKKYFSNDEYLLYA